MAEIVLDAMHDGIDRALAKHIDMGYEGMQTDDPEVWVNGNATLLGELVRNLLDNAINYTPSSPASPGIINVRLLADPFGHVLVLQVENSGPGIAEEDREHIFQPFYRVLGSDVDGSGLGLPIVQEIARQHGASVTLEDAYPKQTQRGVVFSVRLPTTKAPAASE